MTKKFISLIVCLIGANLGLRAGTVSLQPDEIGQLRALIATNPVVAGQFSNLQKAAVVALDATPDPIAKVITEGRLDKDPAKIRTMQSLADMDKIEALTWTWTLTDDTRYAAKAREFILAWARVNQSDGDAINETRFEPLIVAYDLLRQTFSETDRRTVDDWLRNKANVLWKDHRGLKNNWFSHRLKIVGLIGWTLGDQTLIVETITGFHRHIGQNLKPDGSSFDFHERDAFHYHLYDVEPLLVLARVAARNGEDFFSYAATNGATLGGGVAFVVPYANGEKTHMEFVNSKVSFDLKRAKNGQGEYQPHPWNPRESIHLFSEAAWFRSEYGTLAAKLAGRPEGTLFNWQLVLNAVSHHAREMK